LEDIAYLHEIYEQQTEEARQLGMSNIAWLEMNLLPVVADMELRGVWLDDKAVKKFQAKVVKRRDELRIELFGRLEKSFNVSWQREYKKRMERWDTWKRQHQEVVKLSNTMRDDEDKRRKTEDAKAMVAASEKLKPFSKIPSPDNQFSPTSPPKLIMALSELTGLKLTTTNKEWMEENIDLHPAIAELVEFRKYDKLVQFCELKEEIDPTTGLVHANFNQVGTKAGRFSCDSPNLQQIPARTDEGKEFRALFKAQEGEKFVGADLAGIELVILAYFSGETLLLDAINDGKDVHCFTMSQFLTAPYATLLKAKQGEELTEEEVEDIASARATFEASFAMPELKKKDGPVKWVKALRDYTKTMTYGAVYGLTPYGLSVKFHCTKDVAGDFLELLFRAYPNLKTLLQNEEEMGYTRGYAVNPLGRRRWFSPPRKKTYQEIEKEVQKAFDKQKRLWESITDQEWSEAVDEAVKAANKEYRGKIGYIKRQAGNFFPQSLCAEMVKLAMYRFNRDFQTGDKKEGLILTVHDELWAKCKAENAERCRMALEDSMEFAVKKFMPEVMTKVEAVISDFWVK
jgi:DNA polymerase I-like protein with 3'-5' exonuclease and polymerase domains